MRPALALLVLACAASSAQTIIPARAGYLYYAYGDAKVDGAVPEKAGPLNQGQRVTTTNGRAELLLGSGAMLWLDHNSEVRLDSIALDDVRVSLTSGHALLEIIARPEGAQIAITSPSGTDTPVRNGVYSYGGDPRAGTAGTSDAFRRWAALRSYKLFTTRGSKPANWERNNYRIVRHPGFQREFPAASPHLFYAIDYRAGLVYYSEERNFRAPFFLDVEQVFSAGDGPAEIFLGRGITLRLAPDSKVRLLDSDPAHPEFVLDQGTALIEIAETARATPLKAHLGTALVEPARNGLYMLDHAGQMLLVYLGEARIRAGDRNVSARNSQRVNLATLASPARFDTNQRNEFFLWCAERSLALYASTSGVLGDWKPTATPPLVYHERFGTRLPNDRNIVFVQRTQGDLEAIFRNLIERTPF